MRCGLIWSCLALVLCAGTVRAEDFVPNYRAWSAMSGDARWGYVVGLADELRNPGGGDSALRIQLAGAIRICLTRMHVDPPIMAQAVEAWYRADPLRRDAPAHVAFFGAVPGGICQSFVAGQPTQNPANTD